MKPMTSNNLLIREARHEEIEIVHGIMIEAFAEYIGILQPPSGALRETIQSIQSKIEDKGGAIIAFEDNTAVGATIYYYQENYMYIGRVSVLPTYRGKGIGREMIYYLEQQAINIGYSETRVEVRLSLPNNLRLYEKLAYRAIQEVEYPEKTDSWYIMSKNLQQ
jgi:ribosomal protein S18 acetylase RimI-like enzyme